MKVGLCALGCKVNQYESDCYAKMFRDKGYTIGSFDEACDIYVVNTCSVTNIGDRKSRKMLRRAKKQNPDAIVVATGCYAQIKAREVEKMPEVDLCIGTSRRHMLTELIEAVMRGEDIAPIEDVMKKREFEELECFGETERTRAYIKIQDGCENFCSYCIIPYARGAVRSRKTENIIAEANRLCEKGFCEVVLTGISVASYGKDFGFEYTLKDVIASVSQIGGISRIRLSSIDPRAFTDEFIGFLASEPKVCRHFHISAQSGSNSVLKRMNRKYSAEFYLETLKKIRDKMPDASITTDIICGFPGETEEEFRQTESFVQKAQFTKVHVFPYSERTNTAAAMMEQLPVSLREERAKSLIAFSDNISEALMKKQVGKEYSVLFEQEQNGVWDGLSENYLRIYVKTDCPLGGTIRNVRICRYENGRLMGELI